MVLWLCSRISVTRFYSITFIWVSSNAGRLDRMPPNFPVRFRPSDLIQFGYDKKVAQLRSLLPLSVFFSFTFLVRPPCVANYSADQIYLIEAWIVAKPFLPSPDRIHKRTGHVPGEGFEHTPHMNTQEEGSSSRSRSKSFRQHEWRQHPVNTTLHRGKPDVILHPSICQTGKILAHNGLKSQFYKKSWAVQYG